MARAGYVDRRVVLALPVLALGVWYLWSNRGGSHTVTLSDHAYSEVSYDPYAWWSRQRGGPAYTRHYPDQVGPSCLPTALAEDDRGTISVAQRLGLECAYA